MFLALLLAACGSGNNAAPNQSAVKSAAPGGDASGMAIGATFEGSPLTVGKGVLEGKAVVIAYFATW